METWDAIRARRNVRSYRKDPVPAGHDVAFLVGLGYPADRPLAPLAKPDRRPLSEVIHHGRW